MDRLLVSTDVYVPAAEVYEFLRDFPRYERYTEYLDRVTQRGGDGGPGTRYQLHFSWWKLDYTAHSRVTDVSPPERIDWEITQDIDATGCWKIDPHEELPASAPPDADHACNVTMEVSFDPDSASSDAVSLPTLVSFGWVLDRVKGLVEEEATRVVRRAVQDLEGEDRDVSLDVRTDSTAL